MRHLAAVLALVLALAALAGCGSTKSSGGGGTSGSGGKSVRFALVETGPKDDGGWNTNFLHGVRALPRLAPGTATTIVADVNPGSQAQSSLETLATQGYQLIAVNGNFAADVDKLAARYPNVKFLSTYDAKLAANKGIYGAADDEGGYLDGVLAGSTTKTGTLGYVGSYPLPATKRVLDAFMLGAQSVRPGVKVKVLWVNSYYDPTKERQAASALADAGADVLMQDNASPASASVAEQRGLKYVGWAADRSADAPKAWLGGFNYDWGPYFAGQIKQVAAGSWKAVISHPGLKENGIVLFPFGTTVPQSVQQKVKQAEADIVSGRLKVFTGPITDTGGKVVVAKGAAIDSPTVLNSCCSWLAAGVQAQG
ncbi:MAG TPA: BMP family ABC transporter substrate-binding protein [Conexibacter sp.]|nr:BMP family ABC transporter substrate-binding protein [Conexibacter sp.]